MAPHSTLFATMFGRRCAGLLAAILMLASPAELRAEYIEVGIDEAELVRLSGQGTEVIVGNPSIADVAVQSGRLLVVTGKSFGVTNVIVLDADKREILNRRISVAQSQPQLVTLHKGSAKESYVCSPVCHATLVPGDHIAFFENLGKEINIKFGVAATAIEGGGAPGQ